MLDVTISNPSAPSALDASVYIRGSALTKVISRKYQHYQGKIYAVHKLSPLRFSTCG